MEHGKLVISLDFELMWGVRDKRTIESYGKNILGVHQVIPRLLKTFESHKVKGTFSTVGFLFFEKKSELLANLPASLPNYTNNLLSPYGRYFDQVGVNAQSDPHHFAPRLIRQILESPGQEISTHTFSHYYCLEEGQNADNFKADIESARKVAEIYNIKLTSLVFPRNQFNDEYLQVCRELGIICIRGNEHSWLYEARNAEKENLTRRALRLIDAYINISGHNCYDDDYLKSKFPVDIAASRFLRPFSGKLKILDGLRLRRIRSGMTYAAKNGLTYHLWWHPHNFGINQDENFLFLNKILDHYTYLNSKYNFRSYTMSELAEAILRNQN
jgi:peptidoglycan/xylan/chitin deacetylase (PgdA/CDA1 family)